MGRGTRGIVRTISLFNNFMVRIEEVMIDHGSIVFYGTFDAASENIATNRVKIKPNHPNMSRTTHTDAISAVRSATMPPATAWRVLTTPTAPK